MTTNFWDYVQHVTITLNSGQEVPVYGTNCDEMFYADVLPCGALKITKRNHGDEFTHGVSPASPELELLYPPGAWASVEINRKTER